MSRLSFAPPARKPQTESIVPMINVVFLLLIFFLMTSQIAPPEPIETTPPEGESEVPAEADMTLFMGADGALAFRDVTGDELVLKALETARIAFCADGACEGRAAPPLRLKADENVPANVLAGILPALARAGFRDVELVTQ